MFSNYAYIRCPWLGEMDEVIDPTLFDLEENIKK